MFILSLAALKVLEEERKGKTKGNSRGVTTRS